MKSCKLKFMLIVLILLLVMLSFNVSAKLKTIRGTRFITTYDPVELKKVFSEIVEEEDYDEKSKTYKKTGAIMIADKLEFNNAADCKKYAQLRRGTLISYATVEGSTGCSLSESYGYVAGNIKIDSKSKITVKKNWKNKAAYFSYFGKKKKWRAQILKSDEFVVEKTPDRRFTGPNKRYLVEVKSLGGVYYQNKVVVCGYKDFKDSDNCEFTLHTNYKSMSLFGAALAMSFSTYKDKWKKKKPADRKKLKEWEVTNIDSLRWIWFHYGAKYKFDNGKTGTPVFKMSGYPLRSSSSSSFGTATIKPELHKFYFMVIAPFDNKYQKPIYVFRSKQFETYELDIEGLYFFETPAKGFATIIDGDISNDKNYYLKMKPKQMVAINKDVNVKGGGFVHDCPSFFKNYNCLVIDSSVSDAKLVHIEPAKKKKLYSPMGARKIKIDPLLTVFTNGFEYVNIEPVSYNYVKLLYKDGANKKNIKFAKDKVLNFALHSFQSLGVTFTAKFRVSTASLKLYDILYCNHRTGICTLNGVPIKKALKKSRGDACLRTDSDSVHGTLDFRCYKKYACNEAIPNSGRKKIKLLFIGNKYIDYETLGKAVNKFLFGAEGSSLLKIKPFSTSDVLFGAYYINLARKIEIPNFDSESSPPKLKQIIRGCPGQYIFVLTKRSGRDYALDNYAYDFVAADASPVDDERMTLIHEFGHTFGKLDDEYLEHKSGESISFKNSNCIFKPSSGLTSGALSIASPAFALLSDRESSVSNRAYSEWKDLIGDSAAKKLVKQAIEEGWWGCGGICDKGNCQKNLRQAKNSIMKDHTTSKEWGPISDVILRNKLGDYRL